MSNLPRLIHKLSPCETKFFEDQLRTHRKSLLTNDVTGKKRKGVVHVCVGYKITKDTGVTPNVGLCVIVKKKQSPDKLDPGEDIKRYVEKNDLPVVVDVVEESVLKPEDNIDPCFDHTRSRKRDKIVGGLRIKNSRKEGIGGPCCTMGCVVFDKDGKPLGLSVHHGLVKGRERAVADKEPIDQPGRKTQVQTGTTNNTIGHIKDANLNLDCAIFTLNSSREISTEIIGVGRTTGFVEKERLTNGTNVILVGKETVRGEGTIANTNGLVEADGVHRRAILIEPRSSRSNTCLLSNDGDSGSVWIEEGTNEVVGLHLGKVNGETSRYASHAYRIADEMKVKFVKQESHTTKVRSQFGPSVVAGNSGFIFAYIEKRTLRLSFFVVGKGKKVGGPHAPQPNVFSASAPSLVHFRDTFHVAWRNIGTNRIHIMNSKSVKRWGRQNPVPLEIQTHDAPSLGVFKKRLYLAWTNPTTRDIHLLKSSDGKSWGQEVVLAVKSSSCPKLCTFKNRLFLIWRGFKNHRYQINICQSDNGTDFGEWTTVPDVHAVKYNVSKGDSKLVLCWQGIEDHKVNFMQSVDAEKWTDRLELPHTCREEPVFAQNGTGETLAWLDNNPRKDGSLRLLRWDF